MAASRRRQIRELAFKLLFQVDVGKLPLAEVAATFRETISRAQVDERLEESAVRLAQITVAHLEDVDQRIRDAAEKWPLERLAAVDRNIMRLAAAEMLYGHDVPPSVAINEAVELAKKYGTEDSGRFVNGVLGAVARVAAERGEIPKEEKVKLPPESKRAPRRRSPASTPQLG